MNQSPILSPQQTLKKSNTLQSPLLSKSKVYLPSRYAQQQRHDKTGFQDILNSIETRTNSELIKIKPEGSPKFKPNFKLQPLTLEKKPKTSQFKSRPLKRQKNDELNFNEIFLHSRQEVLEQLKKKSCLEDNIKTINKCYEKLLNLDEEKDNNLMEEILATERLQTHDKLSEAISMLESGDAFGLNIQADGVDFYDSQICIDPPDVPVMPNSQSIGPTHAPSIPSNFKAYKQLNLKQLLMRASSGMNGENVEKEAHLSYFLGEVYSQRKLFDQALKFYKRYLGFAKAMEDVVGMGLGANRVAISYYNCGDVEKSVMFHNENLKLSNNQNCFSGFYNIGICYRKLGKYEQAIEYLESALSWAQQKGDEDSECIALGQIGATYQAMDLFEQATLKFESSIEICQRLGKQELKLQNLRYLLRICSMIQIKPIENLEKIVEEAFDCAQQAQDTRMFNVFRSNLGIIRGIREMNEQLPLSEEFNEIEEI